MLRGMVFVDHMNFNIGVQDYYRDKIKAPSPKLNYKTMFQSIVQLIPNVDYMKAMIFAPKPDEFLMKDQVLTSLFIKLL